MAHGIPLITVNAIVCVLGSNCRLHRASSYLLFGLAIADLIATLVCTPLLLEIISQRTFSHSHECTASLERAFGILSHVSCSTSVFHMVAISFDRFAAVVFPLRHKILIGKCRLKAMLTSWTIPILAHFKAYRSTCSLSRQIYWTGNFCLHLLLYFPFLLSDCVVSAPPQENKKAASYPNSFCETDYGREVRAACTIAIGVFTACWVPLMIVLFFTGKLLIKRSGPLHMWFRTLALSNSAMNFLIYSTKIKLHTSVSYEKCSAYVRVLDYRYRLRM